MGHAHHHEHRHNQAESRLGIAFLLTGVFMIVEAAGGIVFNSLALLADAGHMLSDVAALGLSWFAIRVGTRSPTERHTYGFRRTEILAALANGLALWAIVALIFFEAVHRFLAPEPVQGGGMLIVAGIGLVVNAIMAFLLFSTRQESLNLRGAYVHIVSDALGSLGAIFAAILILLTGEYRLDPAISILVGLLILYSSWELIRESVHVLMEGVPRDLNIADVQKTIIDEHGVCCVYDLHVWIIGADKNGLSAHVVMSDNGTSRTELLARLNRLLAERFHIHHITIQLEETHELRLATKDLVCSSGTACKICSISDGS